MDTQQRKYDGLFKIASKHLGQSISLVLGTVYFSGFLVVTAHLGNIGFRDYDAFRMQYLIAGGIVCLLIGLFTYIVGRHVGKIDDSTNALIKHLGDVGANSINWKLTAFIYVIVELLFFATLASFIASSFLFLKQDNTNFIITFYLYLWDTFVQFFIRSKSDLSRWAVLGIGILRGLVIVGYYLLASSMQIKLSYYFIALSIVILFYNDYKKVVSNAIALCLYFTISGVVAFSVAFGATFYGNVKPSFGGGAPIKASIVFKDMQSLPNDIVTSLKIKNRTTTYVDLLAESNNELLIGISKPSGEYNEFMRVKKELVSILMISDTKSISK